MSLYTDIVEAGIPYSNHASDLYVKDTPEARAIIRKHEEAQGRLIVMSPFHSQIDHEQWLDISFMYEPFWEERERIRKKIQGN